MPIVQELRQNLLSMIGAEEAADADTQTLDDILKAINSGLQKIRESGEDIFGEEEASDYINPPTQVTGLQLTRGSKSIVGGAGFATWMHGCTVVLAGDMLQNRLQQTGLNAWALYKPYMGSSASGIAGTVYADAINLEPACVDIRAPVMLAGEWELIPGTGQQDMMAGNAYWSNDHGRRVSSRPWPLDLKKDVGTPEMYFGERSALYTGRVCTRMLLDRLPASDFRVDFRTKFVAPRVASLEDTIQYLVPHEYNESVLIPMVRIEFADVNEHVTVARNNLERQNAGALQILSRLGNKLPRTTHLKRGKF